MKLDLLNNNEFLKTKKGKIVTIEFYVAVAYLRLFDVDFDNYNGEWLNKNNAIFTEKVYTENPTVNFKEEVNKFLEEN